MRGLTFDTFAEMRDRKITWVYGVLLAITLLIIFISGQVRMTVTQSGTQGMETEIAEVTEIAVVEGLDRFISFVIFLTVLATAGTFSGMMSRGRAEFYLSKPISRSGLLLGKLSAVFTVYGLVVTICFLVVAAVTWWVHGAPSTGWFYLLGAGLCNLAVWLVVTSFAGILFGSMPLVLITAFGLWVVYTLLIYHEYLYDLAPRWVAMAVSALYYGLPKMSQVAEIGKSLATGSPVESWLPLWTTLLFAAVLLLVTRRLFEMRSY